MRKRSGWLTNQTARCLCGVTDSTMHHDGICGCPNNGGRMLYYLGYRTRCCCGCGYGSAAVCTAHKDSMTIGERGAEDAVGLPLIHDFVFLLTSFRFIFVAAEVQSVARVKVSVMTERMTHAL